MRFNWYADLVGGVGQGHNSYWPYGSTARVLNPNVDGGVWLDDDTVISRDDAIDKMVALYRDENFAIEHVATSSTSDWYGGGKNWAGTVLAGDYPTVGAFNGDDLPLWAQTNHVVMDASRSGDLLFKRAGDFHLIVLWQTGLKEDVGPGWLEARLGDGGLILWNGANLYLKNQGEDLILCQHVPVGGLNKPARVGDWISYASDELGRVLHRYWDASQGYYISMVYSPDMVIYGGACLCAGSLGAAETPEQLVRDRPIILGMGMVPLLTNPSPGPDPEPTPEPPEPEPEPPQPEPEPPMPSIKKIALGMDLNGTRRYLTFDTENDIPSGSPRLPTMSMNATSYNDPRAVIVPWIFDWAGEPGKWANKQKTELQSDQDGVFVFFNENLALSNNLSRAGLLTIWAAPGGWKLEIPGSMLYLTAGAQLGFFPDGPAQVWKVYDAATGQEIVGPFR